MSNHSPGIAEEIRNDLEFCELWFSSAVEGEPIAQDDIVAMKDMIKHVRTLLEENERITKERDFYKEDRDRCERLERKAHEQLREAREELQQVKKERDDFKQKWHHSNSIILKRDDEVISLRSQLAEKDKVLEWYADETNYQLLEGYANTEVSFDRGQRAYSILSRYKEAVTSEK